VQRVQNQAQVLLSKTVILIFWPENPGSLFLNCGFVPNTEGNVPVTYHCCAFAWPSLLWKFNSPVLISH
jgi:hypothetical protein